ncbi:MAG TPA: 50S ribosomal protein L17 [Nitrospiria bacterium]|jgi:large subunit ribosomal protein L17|nr:50S ribosomal protein L17 [Nitrospiria bacterium]
MRHKKRGRQLGRDTNHRRALFRNLVTSLFEHERIETTEAKAKEIRGIADRIVSLGKQGNLAARRRAGSYLTNPKVLSKLFAEIAPRFATRPGGYTRLIKTRVRFGDGARMAVVELVVQGQPAKPVKPEKTKTGPESNP